MAVAITLLEPNDFPSSDDLLGLDGFPAPVTLFAPYDPPGSATFAAIAKMAILYY